MSTPLAELWVFDFDGTLVETAALKRAAFFDVFPERHAGVVLAALERSPDASRHDIIPEIVAATGDPALDAATIINSYTRQVRERVMAAPATPGAEDALRWAARQGVACIFSMTPEAELVLQLQSRGWDVWLSGIRGYPARKPDTLAEWIIQFGADRVTVIGDGISDAEAAMQNRARFFRADPDWPARVMQATAS